MADISVANTSSALSGKTLLLGDTDATITALHSYSRSSSAPFAVNSGAAAVANLDADKVDGIEGTALLQKSGGTMTGDLLFTDASYDIGKSGATRPRDIFASRNAVVGGTLGVTGATTLSSTVNVTGAATLSSTLDVTGAATVGGTLGVTGVATFTAAPVFPVGTFTPALKFGGGSTGMTGTFEGAYVRSGQEVHVSIRIVLTAKGSSTGNATITGLPFTTAAFFEGLSVKYFDNLGASVAGIYPYMGVSTTTVTLTSLAAGGAASVANMTEASFANNTTLILTGTYRST